LDAAISNENLTFYDINDHRTRYEEDIYKIFHDRHLVEWQRTTTIDNRAICMIGYIGVILAFILNFGLSNFPILFGAHRLEIIYIVGISSFILAFFCAAGALIYKDGHMLVLDTERIFKCILDSKPVLKEVNTALAKANKQNTFINISKNYILKYSQILFGCGCFMLIILLSCYISAHQHELLQNVCITR